MEKMKDAEKMKKNEVTEKVNSPVNTAQKNKKKQKSKEKDNRRVKEKEKNSRLQKLLVLSNVHTELHLTDNTYKYAIIMNCNVLTNKLKHKCMFLLLLYVL
ncbi:MAG: hypothetical protein M1830_010480 [Pleopsidium flavum]|nr:MAG: hypothetical protein M1830_010480 [Pleopsidium flavum]